MNHFKYLVLIIIITHLSYSEIVEEILFRVNEDIITKMDYEDQIDIQKQSFLFQLEKIPYDFEQTVMSNMIINLLIKQEIKRQGINVTDLDVSNQINSLVQINNLGTIDNLKKYITSQGMTWDYFFENQKVSLYRENLLSRVITVKQPDNEELLTYYNENKDNEFKIVARLPRVAVIHFKKDIGMTYSEILKVKSLGKQVEKQLSNGVEFTKLAKQYSDDFKSKNVGGDTGWRTSDDFEEEPELWNAIKELKLGEISPLISSKNGFYIFKVTEEKNSGYVPFEKARTDIQLKLIQDKRQEAYERKIKEIINNSVIKNKTDQFENFNLK